MRRFRVGFAAGVTIKTMVLMLALGACGQNSATGSSTQATATTQSVTTTTSRAAVEPTEKDYNRNNFDRSANVDNKWFALTPGKQLVLDGQVKGDEGTISRRVVATVTDLTKVIDGVPSAVLWEMDYTDGKLTEVELAFFAQDKYGNVWHMGEYPEEYEEGKLVKAPAWIAGREGAKAGISMRATPRVGTSEYAQGYGPKVNWTDRGRVYKTGQRTCVPAGCYDDVLVIDENTRDEPDAHQLKYYASGVGNVQVGWRGNDPDQEVLKLTKVTQLSPSALAKARQEALKLDKRAYKNAKGAYGHLPPAQ